ncbi:MAG TPA: protein-L-isoaspartate O-methyltransferase [Burkholderiaceae bacterium]|nr:protein-L-isoaspartate O-methyltransferase [Burkholderiaceae bacterium]
MNIEQARFNMIEQQIRPWEVLDQGVLSLLSDVHREDFVPPAYRALAFVDTEVPLPEGQRMLAPKIEARLLQELRLTGQERVLEVGTGSGHMAALLGRMARSVTSVEIRPALAACARDNLRRTGLANVTVREGNGSTGQPAEAPFDVILLSGSVAKVPDGLLAQLALGGRLAAIVGHEPVMHAVLITKVAEAQFKRVELFDTVAPRLDGFPEPTRFAF